MIFLLIIAVFVTVTVGLGLESVYSESGSTPNNIKLNAATALMQLVFTTFFIFAVSGPAVVWIGNKLGSGFIRLPAQGWHLPVSIIILLACTDLVEYWFHRLQHRVQWLWRMHSLHHSDESVNASTAYRHCWLERPLLVLFRIPLALIFRADPQVAILAIISSVIITVYGHIDLPIDYGRWSWIFLSPTFHRVHHSCDPGYFGRNFSGFTPIWDVVFGTYIQPPSGRIATGLGMAAPSLKQALFWPLQREL